MTEIKDIDYIIIISKRSYSMTIFKTHKLYVNKFDLFTCFDSLNNEMLYTKNKILYIITYDYMSFNDYSFFKKNRSYVFARNDNSLLFNFYLHNLSTSASMYILYKNFNRSNRHIIYSNRSFYIENKYFFDVEKNKDSCNLYGNKSRFFLEKAKYIMKNEKIS